MSLAGSSETDRTIVSVRSSARRLLGPAVLFVGLAFTVPWLSGVLTVAWQSWLVVVVGLLALVSGSVLPLLSWLARRTIITESKIVSQHGLVTRVREEVLHARKYSVTVRQSPMQRLSRSGDLQLTIPGADAPFRLGDLPRPELLQGLLGDLVARAPGVPAGSAVSTATDATRRLDTGLLAELDDLDHLDNTQAL